jgi:hypothetical protein
MLAGLCTQVHESSLRIVPPFGSTRGIERQENHIGSGKAPRVPDGWGCGKQMLDRRACRLFTIATVSRPTLALQTDQGALLPTIPTKFESAIATWSRFVDFGCRNGDFEGELKIVARAACRSAAAMRRDSADELSASSSPQLAALFGEERTGRPCSPGKTLLVCSGLACRCATLAHAQINASFRWLGHRRFAPRK